MIRLFERHTVRTVHELCGLWDFVSEKYPGKHYRMPVPSCWEMHPDFLTYRGRGTYETTVSLPKSTNLRIVFAGVSHTADVDFDGTRVAHHYNAYTPFEAVIKSAACGTHTLSVACDNTFSEESALHIPNDYFTYGGITRTVSVEYLPDVYIENVHFTPSYRDGVWHGHISLRVKNLGSEEKTVAPRITLADAVIDLGCVTVGGGETVTLEDARAYPTVSPWCCETPTLYTLTATIAEGDTVTDDLIDRVGFRTVEVRGKDILLNGERFFIKGFCRHEDYATVGCSIPFSLMVKDIELLRDAGANSVRTSHYPNDELFLDLCDEMGLAVWEENHARGLYLPNMQNPNFERQCEDCINEMIEHHYNHPAIIIWGILNECASETPEGRAMYEKQYAQIRALDTSRPLTSASCRYYKDICLDLPDIVSFNIYSGWYDDNAVAPEFQKQYAWIGTTGGAGKPMIISEFGGAALYGYRDPSHVRWTEERQAEILDESLACYMNTPDVCGVYIWQFADCRVTDEGGWWFSRARTRNNKGIFDEYRRPKLALEVIKRHFKK